MKYFYLCLIYLLCSCNYPIPASKIPANPLYVFAGERGVPGFAPAEVVMVDRSTLQPIGTRTLLTSMIDAAVFDGQHIWFGYIGDIDVDMHKVALLEKSMNRKSHAAARAKHRAVKVRARTQVGDRTQKLRAVTFFLQRIILRHATNEADRCRLQFQFLSGRGRWHELAPHFDRGAGVHRRELVAARNAGIGDHLQIGEASAVVDLQK